MPILNENNNKIKLKHVINTENELLNEIKHLKLKDYKSSTYLYYDYMKLIYSFIRGRHSYYTNYLDYDMKKKYTEDRQSELSNLISKYSEKYYDYYKEIGYKNNILKNIYYPVLSKAEFKTKINSLVQRYKSTSHTDERKSIRNKITTSCFDYYRFKKSKKLCESNISLKNEKVVFDGIKQFTREYVLHSTRNESNKQN